MREFWTLFKYEFKMQTPFFRKKGKIDILGGAFIILILAILIYATVIFLSQIMQNYLLVETNKVYQPIERAKEMFSVLYLIALGLMTILILERTRKVFADDKNKQIFLRLPLKRRNVFLSKFAVLLTHTYAIGFVFILTINCILSGILSLGAQFWLSTIAVCIFMPIICLLLVSILIVPYITLIEALSNKYLFLFILFTVVLAGIFIVYSMILRVIQTLLTTGSIRFLFNENLVSALQGLYKYAYPISSLVGILFEESILVSFLILLLFSVVSLVIVFLISKNLYRITLYRQQKNTVKIKKTQSVKQREPIVSLLKKEFLCVYRQPKYVFAYFSMAMSMPIMVYCSFTLFETLIFNALGFQINFALALSTVLMFGVLTNTFCSTNITRDGFGILKMKTLPIKISKIFFAKVLFCAIISSLAVVLSCLILIIATPLQVLDGLICLVIGVTFTFSQILIATKLDLNHAKILMSEMEVDDKSSKTLSKVVLIGGALTIIVSASSVFFALFASAIEFLNNAKLLQACTYLVPILIGAIYLTCSFIYFRANISKRFNNLTI